MGLLAQTISTGRIERTNPLPAGRYWIDVFESGQQAWQFWVMYAWDHIEIIKTEHYEGDTEKGYEARTWNLFRTDAPLTWDIELAKKIGWPNTADESINTSDDTVQKPSDYNLLDWDNLGVGTKLAIGGAGIVVAALVVGYVARGFR